MTDQLDHLKTALADRYRIERKLGAGGMATVYLAFDLRHERQVAIKVLRPELAAALGAERFLREIKITAKLNHPHILPLLDSGEANGDLFYVMPYVEGESLRDRLTREERLSIDDALDLAGEIADALGSAHRHDLIHRDIKPENVLLREGHAVVADFGIALAVSAAHGERLTETGLSLGTPSYMSPEQIEGTGIDERSDIYAFGCLLFEMVTGRPPFEGPTALSVVAQHQADPPPDPRSFRPEIPEDLASLILRCLAKEQGERYQTATDLLAEIDCIRRPVAEAGISVYLRSLLRQLRRPVVAVPSVLAIAGLVCLCVWYLQHRADVRWAREVAIPEIERLLVENDVWRNLVAPYRLAEQAEAILGSDPQLQELLAQVSLSINVRTEPPGASVYMKEYAHPDTEWTYLGVSPLEEVRVPIGIFRWKIEKEGYETVLAAASTWNSGSTQGRPGTVIPYDLVRSLDVEGNTPTGMVRVRSTTADAGTLPDYFIGRYEVTNQEYKAFVDAGGYGRREYWRHPFVQDGRELTWDEAMREFVDQTGRPGPSTWLGGVYPQGQGEYPVSGVSWYEAAAYAEYAGMSLPTAVHWNVARGAFTPMIDVYQLGGFAVLAPFANFGGEGTVPVGSLPGVSVYGAYDMAGNVREWCWNQTPQGRVIRGGAWDDNTYESGRMTQAPPMDRSAKNGFRLALYPDLDAVPATAFGVLNVVQAVDPRSLPRVPDAVFRVYKEQFTYDQTPLNASVDFQQESPEGWIHEVVSFDATYGGERILAHLFLPANTSPPYQTVIYFPGAAAPRTASSEDMERNYEFTMFISFLVRNGRAVLFPVYTGTFERRLPAGLPRRGPTHQYSAYLVQVVEDFRRCIDYLETRRDIDTERLAYYGMSWGGVLGSIIPAVEERLAASVLVGGYLTGAERPEANPINYVTRVRTPTLMLNGKYDVQIDAGIRPMFDLLGTPTEHKKLILYDTDHIPPRTEYVKETLAWLDEYLGPVGR